MEKQKTCGECRNYFKADFRTEEPSYYSDLTRKCLVSSELDLKSISNTMMLKNDEDPSMDLCTHFEPIEKEEPEIRLQGKKVKGKK